MKRFAGQDLGSTRWPVPMKKCVVEVHSVDVVVDCLVAVNLAEDEELGLAIAMGCRMCRIYYLFTSKDMV